MRVPVLAVVSLGLSGCFLFGPPKSKDPLEKVEARLDTYLTNTRTSTPTQATGTSAESWSNRPVTIALQNYTEAITKIELKRVSGSLEANCELKDEDGKPLIYAAITDWAGISTQYTVTLTADTKDGSFTKTFGPYDVTVNPANLVVSGSHGFNDQTSDGVSVASGEFFSTKAVDIGFGGYNGPNLSSYSVRHSPRYFNFAFLTENNALQAVSPDLVNSVYTFNYLKNDCGFFTTTFAVYTGPLDPETAPLTLAEVRALPDPPAGATKLVLTAGMKFVYRTGEGFKGLLKVKAVGLQGNTRTTDIAFSSEQ